MLLCLPEQAAAHLVSTRFGELYSGLLHPLTTLQHLVPWLALGLLGGLQAPRTARWALLAFPLAVLAGPHHVVALAA
jgi:hydrogenase/urease accessory protein HupE